MQSTSPFTLPDWLAIMSLVVSILSLFLGGFAVYQANASARRAEELNAQTQEALKQISSSVKTIENIVNIQQAQQMSVIAKTQERLVDVVANTTNANVNANIENLIDKKLSSMSADEHYY